MTKVLGRRRHRLGTVPLFFLLVGLFLSTTSALAQEPAISTPPPETGRQDATTTHRPAENGVHELLVLANRDYFEGRYAEAARGYEAILADGLVNGHIYYNLGNCGIRLGQVGKAILDYRKAQILLPRDGDLKANLLYARSLRKDRTDETPSSLRHTIAFWYYSMNFRELLAAFCVLNLLFWASLFVWLFRSNEWIRWTTVLTLILSLVMGGSAFLKHRETFRNEDGVVLVEEAPVRAGFSQNDTVLFVLHEGTEFRILDREQGWWKIVLADGKKGWISSRSGGRVSLNTASASESR